MSREYTLRQCRDDMRQMWKWLSENPTKKKEDFAEAHSDYPMLQDNCAACEYDSHNKGSCESCPVNWPLDDRGDINCVHKFSPFGNWLSAKDPRMRAIWAKEVYKLASQIKVK